MGKSDGSILFNTIAPLYGLFYNIQKRWFARVIRDVAPELDLTCFRTIIDVGCGTGALCSVLNSMGLSVTGIDPAQRMLDIARAKPENKDVQFLQANVLETLPFADKSFDIAIASYVAHGLKAEERKLMYAEMSRLTNEWVIIYDYNDQRSFLITIAEWLERGDYFHFISHAEPEMRDCVSEMKKCFSEVRVVNVDTRGAWYICKPHHDN